MKIRFCSILFLFFLIPCFNISAMAADVEISEMKICTEIVDRSPVGVSDNFSNALEKIYCYTEINAENTPLSITHVWYFNDRKMAEIPLSVNSSAWRTWSSKRIMSSWSGKWRVDVLGPAGEVLMQKNFAVGKAPEYELNEY